MKGLKPAIKDNLVSIINRPQTLHGWENIIIQIDANIYQREIEKREEFGKTLPEPPSNLPTITDTLPTSTDTPPSLPILSPPLPIQRSFQWMSTLFEPLQHLEENLHKLNANTVSKTTSVSTAENRAMLRLTIRENSPTFSNDD